MFTGFVAIFIFPTVKDGIVSDKISSLNKQAVLFMIHKY